MNEGTRGRMIETAAGLVHRRGFHGTSLNEILAGSGAPRGSLYYHFPGGKEELVLEATRRGVEAVSGALREALARSGDPAEAVRAFVEAAGAELRGSGYVFGCPVAPIILDSPGSEALERVCRASLEEWQGLLVGGLRAAGIEEGRAGSLANMVLCGLEGGLILARARRDIAPLDAAAAELAAMVRGVLDRGAGG